MPPTTVHRGREPYGGDQLAGSISVGGFLPGPLKASRGKYWPLTADITWSATKRHFFLVVASSLAALLVAEVGLRIFSATPKPLSLRQYSVQIGNAERPQWVDWHTLPLLHGSATSDPRLKKELPPSIQFRIRYDASAGHRRPYMYGEGANAFVDISTQADGYRSELPSAERTTGIGRIVAVGDSFLFGDGVPLEATFAQLLNQTLDNTEIVNLGVPGYDISDILATTQIRGLPLDPDLVLYTLVLNDTPLTKSPLLVELSRIAQERNRKFFSPPSEMASYSALGSLMQKAQRQHELDIAYRDVVKRSFQTGIRSRRAFDKKLLQMRDEVEASGAKFAVAIFPLLNRLDGKYPFEVLHASLTQMFDAEGIDSIDLYPAFQGQAASDLWVHPTDQHPNEIGHKIAADALQPFLELLLKE
ncbi:MAG: SGNH/GDSL hydrolase family protein [Planctomycetota bacterium]|nr:SGNH/GDSL hydrolase family protein [Planctomycetota bacterium]